MCGTNGIFNFSGVALDLTPGLLENVNDAMRHRGPNDSGRWIEEDGRIGLAQRHLGILDLSPAGHQPMLPPKDTAIVFNEFDRG